MNKNITNAIVSRTLKEDPDSSEVSLELVSRADTVNFKLVEIDD